MKKEIFQHRFVIALLCASIITVVYILFSAWDSNGFSFDDSNFALGVKSYSLVNTRPHLPGYFVHVKLLSLLTIITGKAFTAMTLLSAIYSGLAIGMLFLLLKKWIGTHDALYVALFTATNPVVWFFGCSTEIYSFDLFFSITLVYLGFSSRWIYLLPAFMAFGAGVRQSSIILLFPLYGYLWFEYHRNSGIDWKKCVYAHGIGVLVFFAWLVPMIRSAGGLSQYLALYKTHDPMDPLTLPQNLYRFISFNVTTGISFLIAVACILIFPKKEKKESTGKDYFHKDRISVFVKVLLVWIVPPLLVFLFYAYSKGYILLIFGGVMCLLFLAMHSHTCRRKLLLALTIMQALYFILTPYSSPDIDSYVAPKYRKQRFLFIWLDRIQSIYLMARSHYRYLEKVDALISAVSDTIESKTNEQFYRKKYVLIDRTCPIVARSLQVKHPHIHFAAQDLYSDEDFFSYKGLKFYNETGVRRLLQSSLIFGRTDFIERYNLDPIITKKVYGEYSLYSYKDDAFAQGDIPHAVLFQRN